MARTPKKNTNQLDIDLNGIEDNATREAFMAVLRFVNDLSSRGLETQGPVIGSGFLTGTKTASIDPDGNASLGSLETEGMGRLKFMVKSGTLTAGTSITLESPTGTRILGAVGFTTLLGIATTTWIPMRINDGSSDVTMSIATTGRSNKLKLTNNDGSLDNSYNVIIFYAE